MDDLGLGHAVAQPARSRIAIDARQRLGNCCGLIVVELGLSAEVTSSKRSTRRTAFSPTEYEAISAFRVPIWTAPA